MVVRSRAHQRLLEWKHALRHKLIEVDEICLRRLGIILELDITWQRPLDYGSHEDGHFTFLAPLLARVFLFQLEIFDLAFSLHVSFPFILSTDELIFLSRRRQVTLQLRLINRRKSHILRLT